MRMLVALTAAALLVACGGSATREAAPASADALSSSTPAPGTAATATGTDTVTGTDTHVDVDVDEPVLPVQLTDDTGTEVTIESIDRIVPVDGDLAEIVFALGLGDRVVATDISATYPPEVDGVPDIGYQRALSAEPIAAVEPTVVLATDLAGPPETLDQLRAIHVPLVVIERQPTLDGPAAKIRAVAAALGVPARGDALAGAVQRQIDAAAASGATAADFPRVLPMYLRGDSVQLILGKGTGIDALIPAVGATDVAAELGIVDTRQITAEALLHAAPDVLLVTTTGLESVGGIDGLLAIPGIAETPAGEQRRVLAYEDQFLLGGGPRTGQLMQQLIADLHGRPAPPLISNPTVGER